MTAELEVIFLHIMLFGEFDIKYCKTLQAFSLSLQKAQDWTGKLFFFFVFTIDTFNAEMSMTGAVPFITLVNALDVHMSYCLAQYSTGGPHFSSFICCCFVLESRNNALFLLWQTVSKNYRGCTHSNTNTDPLPCSDLEPEVRIFA